MPAQILRRNADCQSAVSQVANLLTPYVAELFREELSRLCGAPHKGLRERANSVSDIRTTILSEIQRLAEAEKKPVPELKDDLVLLESGMDSLMLAILVARLEETLGLDPFTASEDVFYPVTLGDFIKAYEAAKP